MLPYLLKRLLLSIPALLLIATAVFFLSRLLPDSDRAESILQEEGGFYNSGSAETRQASYRNYLKRTGLDQPLFYFSVRSAVEADTLHKIYPESERLLLQRLAWHYGNWSAVWDYYISIKNLDKKLTDLEKRQLQPLLENLLKETDKPASNATLTNVAGIIADSNAKADLAGVHQKFESLTNSRSAYAYLLPGFHWNGSRNQYHSWLSKTLRGDFGQSFKDGRPVYTIITALVANTFTIILASIIIACFLALKFSVLFSLQQFNWLKKTVLPALFIMDSIPTFVLALLLLVFLANPSFLQIFPVYGLGYYQTQDSRGVSQIPFMILPIICLTLAILPYLTNQFYRAIEEASQADYVRTARAKGLSEYRIIRKHILRNALLSVITLLSDYLPALVAGAVVIETIFAIPGVGTLLINAVLSRDYPVIIGIVLLVALLKVIAHFMADLFYRLADPRIRYVAS